MFWKGIHKFSRIEVAPGGASYGFGSYNTLGRKYFVNNITGSSTNDGRTWDRAMDQLSTAITASEVHRQDRGSVSTNDYIRNTIVVQATGTAYTAVSALPNYCDIVGLGATPRGNGTGIVRIDGAGAADAMAGTARGLGLYNLQCMQSAAGSYYGLDLATCFRSILEDMGFVNNGSGGMRVVQGGSIVIHNSHAGHDTYAQIYGLEVAGGANFNACLITDSDFWGDTAGVLMSNTSGKETIIKNCFAGGGTYGFQDTSPSDMPHMVHYIKCYGKGTASTSINSAGFKLTHVYTERCIGCIDNANGTLYRYPTMTD